MKRFLFLANCPSPYRVRFFDLLGADARVTVLFWDRPEEVTDRHADWFVAGEGNFEQVYLKKSLGGVCTGAVAWLKKPWDAVIICGYSDPAAMLAISYCRMKGIPFWLEVDGGLIRREPKWKYLLKKYLVSGAAGFLSTGARTTEFLVHYGARREKIFCYPFSSLEEKDILDSPVPAAEKTALRETLGMTGERIVLAVGQFIPRKGFDLLLRAAKELPETVGVYIVGGEPTEEYLQMSRELDLKNVHFCGFQKKQDLARYYRAADLFVLPTREDIWGLVVNEAMAFGLPVITTDNCVAGLEMIRDGVNGRIVPVEDVKALTEAVKAVLSSNLDQMGRAALETAGKYTIEAMARTHLDILEGR